MHMAASVRNRALCTSLYSTTHWEVDNPQVSYCNQIFNYKHSTFLRHKVIRALPNATAAYCSGHNHTQTIL